MSDLHMSEDRGSPVGGGGFCGGEVSKILAVFTLSCHGDPRLIFMEIPQKASSPGQGPWNLLQTCRYNPTEIGTSQKQLRSFQFQHEFEGITV